MTKHVCERAGCGRPAKWAPKLCVPASGVPIDLHQPLSIVLCLPVCDEHFAEMKAPEFVEDEKMRKLFRTIADMSVPADQRHIRGPVPPDFARAFFTKLRLDSDEYRAYVAHKEKS